MADDFADIFSNHEELIRAAKERDKAERAEIDANNSAARAALSAIVLPALQAAKQAVEAQGYEATLADGLQASVPYLTFKFVPRKAPNQRLPSDLTFEASSNGRVQCKHELRGPSSTEKGSPTSPWSKAFNELTSEWVTEQCRAFIAAALRLYERR